MRVNPVAETGVPRVFFSPESEVQPLRSNMMRFTEYKLRGIQPLVVSDPLLGGMYHFRSHTVGINRFGL